MNKHNKINVCNITKLELDTIINAANHSLLGGSGVDCANNRVAGRGLLQECMKLDGYESGKVKMTDIYNQLCMKVILTVGTVYYRKGNESVKLAHCYRNSHTIAKG